MQAKLISLAIGYIFGCFLTADVVANKYAGKSASEIGGTGNPGMANVMAQLGFVPGIITLAGDLAKCLLAGLWCYFLFHETGMIVVLYAGLGCTLGHDFPAWKHYKGGKGVATTSMTVVMYSFLAGVVANIVGLLVVLATKYLCIGGPFIPLTFAVLMFVKGDIEAGIIGVILTVLSVIKHSGSIRGIKSGATSKTDVIAALKKKSAAKDEK